MKIQTYIVKIQMPDGDHIGAGYLQDEIEACCNSEDHDRFKVTVTKVAELALPKNSDKLPIDKLLYLEGTIRGEENTLRDVLKELEEREKDIESRDPDYRQMSDKHRKARLAEIAKMKGFIVRELAHLTETNEPQP